MNILKREWLFYRKQTVYWGIGLFALILISFYKVSGMNSTPGGVEEVLKSLPPMLQAFFGAGAVDYTTGVGSYSMIHLYVVIALALHAAILGANIFAKEELDKTFEFLYVKGVKRWRILIVKVLAGIGILLFLDLLCFLAIMLAAMMMGMTLDIGGILPFITSLILVQIFFFSLGLVVSLLLRNSQKAGMIGCCVVLIMFMISMYVKVGGNLEMIDKLSLFHYADTTYIKAYEYGGISTMMILLISVVLIGVSEYLHNKRDLL